MTEVWTKWESLVINGVFPLRRFLSASDHSVVFLTEFKAQNLPNAAIKLVPADLALADAQLSHWRATAALSHPHLIRLLEAGRCRLGGQDFLFAVMEYAEETLAQVLPHRALTPDEVRQMLLPTLDVLAFLHARKLVHGQLKPPNFLVIDDQLKLSSDNVRPVGESTANTPKPSPYDPPEARNGRMSTAGDVWGLGLTMVAALTQRLPVWADDRSETISLPTTLPATFADVVRRCLSRNPASRPTVADLEREFGKVAAAPSPSQQVATQPLVAPAGVPLPAASSHAAPQPPASKTAVPQPLASRTVVRQPGAPQSAVPQSAIPRSAVPQSAIPRSGVPQSAVPRSAVLPPARAPSARPGGPSVAPVGVSSPPRAEALLPQTAGDSVLQPAAGPGPSRVAPEQEPPDQRSFFPTIAVLMIVLLAVWGGSRLFRKHPDSQQPTMRPAQTSSQQTTPSESALQNPDEPQSTLPRASAAPSGTRPAGASTGSSRPARGADRPSRPAEAGSPSAVHEEIPEVSRSARESIRGRIKIAVRVTVDRSGNVIDETLENPGPSKYFARAAVNAARKWKFAPSDTQDSRKWLLWFEFTRAGATGHASPRP